MNFDDLQAIQRLVNDFAWHADRGEDALLSDLFLPEGVLHVGGQELKGRAQIADDCRRRSSANQRTTRHVWTNLRLDADGDDAFRGTAIQLTFEQAGPERQTQIRVNDVSD